MSIINHGGCAWRGDNHYKWNKPPVSPNAEDKKPGAETDDIIFTRNKLQGNSRGATAGVRCDNCLPHSGPFSPPI